MSTEIYEKLPESTGYVTDAPAAAHVTMRPYEIDDAKFILHSWLKSMRGMYRDAKDADYYDGAQARILRCSKRAKVVIAADIEKPWFIYGYCVADEPASDADPLVVHYAFVKNPYRRQGIGTALLEELGWHPGRLVVATHWNFYLKDIKRVVKIHYNPWLLDQNDPE